MYIYKTINLINGKIYIGKSNGKNKYYLGSGYLILKAIKKYGRNNFVKEILEDNISPSLINEREKYWIKIYNSTDLQIGYNLTVGGDGVNFVSEELRLQASLRNSGSDNPFFGKHHSQETKDYLSYLHTEIYIGKNHPRYGTHCSDETKNRISESNSGEKSKNLGKHHVQESKDKMSVSVQQRKQNKSNKYTGVTKLPSGKYRAGIKYRKKFYHLGVFDSEIEAALAYNKKAIELYSDNARINIIES